MTFTSLFLFVYFFVVFSVACIAQPITYGTHTKDSTYEKQIIDSLSLSSEFLLQLKPEKSIYVYDFTYSMAGRKSQEVGDNTKPQFQAYTKSKHTLELKPNSPSTYNCLLTCSPLTLYGTQITNRGTLKDSSFHVEEYKYKNASFDINSNCSLSKYIDNYQSVFEYPAVIRVRSLFTEDIDRKFIRYLFPKFSPDKLEIGDVWNVQYKDSTTTMTAPIVYTFNIDYKVISFRKKDNTNIVTIEFKSNNNKIYQKSYPDTEFENTMEVDDFIYGVYEIDMKTGIPQKVSINSRIELVSKDFKQRVVDAKRMDQSFEYVLL
jgi:hypothetical protein